MKIFNVILNGEAAKEFCHKSVEFKVDWIKKHTDQQNIDLIMDFINNPPKNNDCGCGCGDKKVKLTVKEELPVTEIEVHDEPQEIHSSEKPKSLKFRRK